MCTVSIESFKKMIFPVSDAGIIYNIHGPWYINTQTIHFKCNIAEKVEVLGVNLV